MGAEFWKKSKTSVVASKKSGFGGQEMRKGSFPMGREPLTAAGVVTLILTPDPIHVSQLCSISASKRGWQPTDACGAGPR